MTWDDQARCLALGALEGSYPGMPQTRKVQVLLTSGQGAFTTEGGITVTYTGTPLEVRLDQAFFP